MASNLLRREREREGARGINKKKAQGGAGARVCVYVCACTARTVSATGTPPQLRELLEFDRMLGMVGQGGREGRGSE